MAKITCKTCGKEFDGRTDQKFCSASCKQRAYVERKQGITFEKKEIIYSFKMSEYKKVESEFEDFTLYCFMRKNYKLKFKTDEFTDYVRSFNSDFWEKVWNPNTTEGKQFELFKQLFHSGQCEVVE